LRLAAFIAIIGLAACILAPTPSIASSAPLGERLSKSDLKLYRLAFTYAERAKWSHVWRIVRKAENPLPAKILRWMYHSRPGTPAGFDEITKFVTANPDWPSQQRLRRHAEKAIKGKVAADRLLEWFARNPPVTAVGGGELGAALLASGRTAEGEAIVRDAWVNGDFNNRDEKAFLKRHERLLTSDHHERRLDRLLWDGAYYQIRRAIRRVGPEQHALARARNALRRSSPDVEDAVAAVPQHLQSDAGLLYERFRWRRRKGKYAGAMEILANPPADWVRPDKWWNDRRIIARRLITRERAKEAYGVIRDHGLTAGPDFAAAEWFAGWIALRFLKKPNEALAHFERMHGAVNYPVSQARAAYWAGRAAEALNDAEKARRWYETAAKFNAVFYGQLARDRAQLPSPTESPDPAPSNEAFERFAKTELARAAILLQQLGQTRLAQKFVDRIARLSDEPEHLAMTARLATGIGRVDLAVRVSRHAYHRGVLLSSSGFPIIKAPATKPELGLALAVARQESSMNTWAKSSAGARGIMQLMPATAQTVARQLRVRYSPSRLTRDPKYNVKLGRAYLRSLLRQYRGSYVLAIAAYNAGPPALKEWIRRNGDPRKPGVDPIDWIELIPYPSSRNYVQRVLENLQVYRGRLGVDPLARNLQHDLNR
jgi:soluble lytic murein transglycosylase